MSTSLNRLKVEVLESGGHSEAYGFGHISLALKSTTKPISEMPDLAIRVGFRHHTYIPDRQIPLTFINAKVYFTLFLHCLLRATDALCDGFNRGIRRP